jgi:serine protease Do
MVRTVVASARNGGRLMRPWIGLIGQTVDSDLAEAVGLARPGGVIVSQVYADGPAQGAGLRKGDVIISVDGETVHDLEAFQFRVATGELGGSSEVEVWRQRDVASLSFPLVEAPEDPPRNETLLLERHPLAGATVANLSPALAEELDLPGAWEGVIVTKIGPGSVANRLRFRVGDILLVVNGREVKRVGELMGLLNQPSRDWTITFSRGGRVRTTEFNG